MNFQELFFLLYTLPYSCIFTIFLYYLHNYIIQKHPQRERRLSKKQANKTRGEYCPPVVLTAPVGWAVRGSHSATPDAASRLSSLGGV